MTAGIWGFAFVAQRAGMEHIGPFLFNAIRFALGGLWLLPFIFLSKKNRSILQELLKKDTLWKGIVLGSILFVAASLQQIGIIYTTAGKAGFITSLYVILVPIFGILISKSTSLSTWTGALIAVLGLFLLSFHSEIIIGKGDLIVFSAAFLWAFHVLLIDHFVDQTSALMLALYQFLICSLLSIIMALFFESFHWIDLTKTAVPILYAGLLSVGVGYTLQVVAQKEAHPSHAAIIMSLESVFAALGGWIILNESLSHREMLGCGLMLSGMIISQLRITKQNTEAVKKW